MLPFSKGCPKYTLSTTYLKSKILIHQRSSLESNRSFFSAIQMHKDSMNCCIKSLRQKPCIFGSSKSVHSLAVFHKNSVKKPLTNNQKVKTIVKIEPSTKSQDTKQRYYAVQRGRETGVFKKLEDAMQSVDRFTNARWKVFKSYKEAVLFVKEADTDLKNISDTGRYYAVRRGRKTGIFSTWDETKEVIGGYRKAEYKLFKNQKEAEAYIDENPYADLVANSTGKFYAVKSGRQSGIFETAEEAIKHTLNFSHQEIKRFDEYDTAKEYLQEMMGDKQASCEEGLLSLKTNNNNNEEKERICNVYTDGSSRGNGMCGAVAGVGVFYGDGDRRNVSRLLGSGSQTNNRAELSAVIDALLQAQLDRPDRLNIYSDSQYSIDLMTTLRSKWEERVYRRGNGKWMLNADLIQQGHQLLNELDKLNVSVAFHQIKGHSDNYGNTQADKLANQGATMEGGYVRVADKDVEAEQKEEQQIWELLMDTP